MPSSVPHSSIAPTVTTSVPAGGPELRITKTVSHLFNAYGRADVGPRLHDREDPGLPYLVVDEGGVVHG